MTLVSRLTAEAWLTLALFLVSALGLVFMGSLVAEPKALFGRSLSAIEPSLFPRLVLASLALLSGALIYLRHSTYLVSERAAVDREGLARAVMLFGVMLFYGMTMAPFGFLISTAISLAAISVIAGNRSVPVILAVAIIGPIVLFLIAERGLAVSLPELSEIEFAYQRVFNLFEGGQAPATPEAAQ